jgi:hypothetical protein
MVRSRLSLSIIALTAVLASGCSTSPPGAGFTDGEKAPSAAVESPNVRSDLPEPPPPDSGDAKLAPVAPDLPDKDEAPVRTEPKGQ